MSNIEGPLNGVVVLDLTRIRAGAGATKLLAEQGARVIKIERPDGMGDPVRGYPPMGHDGMSTFFRWLHHDQESVTLDLKLEEEKEKFLELVKHADVVVENYSPTVMTRLGLSHDDLKEVNPDIIMASVSGYGQTGPFSPKPAFNTAMGAESGFMVTNNPEGEPQLDALLAADTIGGQLTFAGVLSALYDREHNPGRGGVHVDVSMLEVMTYLQGYQIATHSAHGEVEYPNRKDHMLLAPVGMFEVDGGNDSIVISAATDRQFERLCEVMNREDLLHQQRFASPVSRAINRDQLHTELEQTFHTRSAAYWCDVLKVNNISCSPINGVGESLQHPQILERNVLVPMEEAEDAFRIAAHPIRMKGLERPSIRSRTPMLGEHTENVFAELEQNNTLGSDKAEQDSKISTVENPRNGPLDGVVVLDLTRFHSGPVTGKLMEEQGARVIKVEHPLPSTTPTREYYPKTQGRDSTFFRWLHHDKESIVIDLKTEREKFLELVKHADVVLENFPGKKMKELGLSYDDLKEANPHIVLTSVSGYGQDGPYSRKAALNSTLEAEAGFVAANNPEHDPKLDALMTGSTVTGILAFAGTLSALYAREKHVEHEGNHVDVPMIDVLAYLQGLQIAEYTAHGIEFFPDGVDQITAAPVGVFSVDNGDDHIVFSAAPQAVYERLCRALDRSDLIDDTRFLDSRLRFENRKLLRTELETTLNENTAVFWKNRLDQENVPSSLVNTIADLYEHPQIIDRGVMIPELDAPDEMMVPGHPIRSESIQRPQAVAPAPTRGEHTQAIFDEIEKTGSLGSDQMRSDNAILEDLQSVAEKKLKRAKTG